MTILNKSLSEKSLATLDLFLSGALAPLEGYLDLDDHINVLTNHRLANGFLWPLAFSLELTVAEKLQAQLTGRIALLGDEDRMLAEVKVSSVYRLPKEVAEAAGKDPQTWYASGTVAATGKVLHPAFNSIRHHAPALGKQLRGSGWKSIIAVHAAEELNTGEMKQACEWLKSSPDKVGGVLLQIDADDRDPALHQQMREIRSQVRCNAAKQIKLNLLPEIEELDSVRRVLLQALIARNFGATGFLISPATPRLTQRWLLQHQDEIGLELILVKRSGLRTEINTGETSIKQAA
uniref:ATP-sulfurylase n=1 Tax=uncultured Thiotrichaceae bacterium TaxID=298394 RepID=A0A6S6UFA4_9GAMM|nr:MAG: ATP-sulfurylase [uncultured Thiotrichaceae bacterium]